VRVAFVMVGLHILALTLLSACMPQRADSTPVIEVDDATALADQPVRIRVTGLAPAQRVTVIAEATDYSGQAWRAHANVIANGDGVADLSRDAPTDGSYQGADAMGLFWSMDPVGGPAGQSWFSPLYPELNGAYTVRLTASVGATAVEQLLRREWMVAGVTHRRLHLGSDGAAGDLFEPHGSDRASNGVLLIGGSGGGAGPKFEAALLASHGYPALAVSFFNAPGLPDSLTDIAVEYFAVAARQLPGPVHVIGYSRGTEVAQLLAAFYPELVRSIVVCAPGASIAPAFPGPGNAWMHQGAPVRFIPYDLIQAPVLAIAGGDDRLWPSEAAALTIQQRTGDRPLIYADAGHAVAGPPYLATSTSVVHPVTGEELDFGGTRAADARARSESWPLILAFLAQHQ
jgi:pimeloyl-ACP methyl ester carboxylesterase